MFYLNGILKLMRIGFFDCKFGASGDMLLAAILDCLIREAGDEKPLEIWSEKIIHLLDLEDGGRFEKKFVTKGKENLSALKIDFYVAAEHANDFHSHDHRHYSEIKKCLTKLVVENKLSPEINKETIKLFDIIAAAEAKVHECTVDNVYFHEVGAFDSIMDIVGFAAAFEMLNLDKVVVTPVGVGSGKVNTAHGLLDVPTPAVAELIEKHQLKLNDLSLKGECLTPTGAALIAGIVDEWSGEEPQGKILSEGIGAGSFDFEYPNVVRVGVYEG